MDFYRNFLLIALFCGVACSSVETKIAPPTAPDFAGVPHPNGTDLSDLGAIFTSEKAPKDLNFSKDCDADFRTLKAAILSPNELAEGTKELIRRDPVAYHWCFYSKLWYLEQNVKNKAYVDERQKEVLNTYEFLTPVARAFAAEFHDPRYLQWAISRYRKMSEWVFYRRVELTPEGSSQMVEIFAPLGQWRTQNSSYSVLDKYHLLQGPPPSSFIPAPPETLPLTQPTVRPLEEPTPTASGAPVVVPSEASTPSPTPSPSASASEAGATPGPIPSVEPTPSPYEAGPAAAH